MESLKETAEPAGRIVTFYLYKGVTGRSMAVANLAWILATNGKRVLLIDWDLEAPGLHRYLHPFMDDNELVDSPGLIDYFVDFATEARVAAHTANGSDASWHERYLDLLGYVRSLEWEFEKGSLDFVPAGKQSAAYAVRVTTFDWQEFYTKLGGGVLLENLKRQLRADYDYILIDSRLEELGPDVVPYDRAVLRLGDKVDETLARARSEAVVFLVVYGDERFKASPDVYSAQELREILASGKRIVPVLVQNARWVDLPEEIRGFSGVHLREVQDAFALDSFRHQLRELLQASAPTMVTHADDPQKGQWGGKTTRNGRTISSDVRPISDDWFDITVQVQGQTPLTEAVTFYLHPSFVPGVQTVPPVDGVAVLRLQGWGAFTIGAVADSGRTILEIDLAQVSSAPEKFREREVRPTKSQLQPELAAPPTRNTPGAGQEVFALPAQHLFDQLGGVRRLESMVFEPADSRHLGSGQALYAVQSKRVCLCHSFRNRGLRSIQPEAHSFQGLFGADISVIIRGVVGVASGAEFRIHSVAERLTAGLDCFPAIKARGVTQCDRRIE